MIKPIKLNKRASVGAVVEDSIAAVLVIMAVLLFLAFSSTLFVFEKNDISVKSKNQALFLEQNQIIDEISALKYQIDGKEINFIDLLRLSKIDQKYKIILDEKISEIKNIYPKFEMDEKILDKIYSNEPKIIIPSNQTTTYEVKIK